MSNTQTSREPASQRSAAEGVPTKLEVVVLPVSDVDRARRFYAGLGWRLDADLTRGESFRVVQLTPPSSPCSIIFGTGVTTAAPGSIQGLMLVVDDINAARAELVGRGVEVSAVFHDEGGVFHHPGTKGRVAGPDPEHRSYSTWASFSDPDGNGWLLQEIKARLPGRVWPTPTEQGATVPRPQRTPELLGQTVVVLGGSSGIGLETARRARAEGAEVILTGRNPERLQHAAKELGARSFAAFDASDATALAKFFGDLPHRIDHVMLTAGHPHYGRMLDMDAAQLRQGLDEHALLVLQVARQAARKVRPGGALIFMGGTGGRRPRVGTGIASTVTAALPSLAANLALELAPVRVNLIAPGFVDSPLSASLLGDGLEERRRQLRSTLPIGRVVGPADVAALAVHLMINTALTGATYDVDGGQQLID
jgi:NAD(P)-dependent dehydrogenase (short-subunit alcohol dehydrogenase family)/predicted enzyme related to lactoylglutathione lyase